VSTSDPRDEGGRIPCGHCRNHVEMYDHRGPCCICRRTLAAEERRRVPIVPWAEGAVDDTPREAT
jgi:hypothetical protein